MDQNRYILTLNCPDTVGIVAAVSSFLAERSLSIEESAQFHEPDGNTFFMRTEFSKPSPGAVKLPELEAAFIAVARRFGMKWKMHDPAVRPRIVIAVSKIGHCLYDLFHRQETGWLNADIVAVVSNHVDMKHVCDWRKVPFHHVPISADTKPESERRILGIVEESGAELLVLARYMQVFSPETCAKISGKAINIHHSFLPSFKGASPYKQAHDRGVKLIGATAHYVTLDLDEGPIIEQAVARVAHHHSTKGLMETGRDLECQVLSRAVRWHLERRVEMNGHKTVVFA